MARMMAALVLVLAAGTVAAQDSRAEQLRALHAKYESKVAVLTWNSRTNVMGQQLDTEQSTTAVLVGERGLALLSGQPFAASPAGMLGRGSAPVLEDFKLHAAAAHDATEALADGANNLRWYTAKGAARGVEFSADAAVPALGEEVVIIGAHDATLNFARFFRTARINAVVEEGKYYGLDGSINDCLGALVVTMQGTPIGVVGQKPGKGDEAAGGIGRMIGGLSDPARMMGNRVLFTPAVFRESMQKALAGMPAATVADAFSGSVAGATRREATKDIFVLIDVKSGPVPAIGDKVAVRNAAGDVVCELAISRHYEDNGAITQIGGAVDDAESKLVIQPGMAVTVPPLAPWRGFRGVERLLKMDKDLLQSGYGGKADAGFRLSQRPQEGSPAAEAGLQNGDVIIKVGDKAVTPEMDLPAFLKLLGEQQGEVKLTILRRGGEQAEVTVR